ncbi:transcription factor RFX4-like isoform X3 [Eriocheir sinensis]|uniref:transcription factor RFX4-like isoform X3 n=1 Tax=Eriocheir sinensis TaxID=95602 RepID=UPI0021C719ED|nr:transcription factor RFX4-like isoform X3 [Eriocheir sinensis]
MKIYQDIWPRGAAVAGPSMASAETGGLHAYTQLKQMTSDVGRETSSAAAEREDRGTAEAIGAAADEARVAGGGGGGGEEERRIKGSNRQDSKENERRLIAGGSEGGGRGGGGGGGGGGGPAGGGGGGGRSGGRRGVSGNGHGGIRNLRPHSTPATLLWLEENYEMAEGVCIPRNTLYLHYVDFCDKKSLQPVNAASFGKIIRQQFPGLTTRRLGTRGQSRYHYYGIAIREGSIYYEVHYSRKGNTSNDIKKETDKQVALFPGRGKLSTVLPEFPSLKDVLLPPHVAPDKVATFVMMYRTHCQRILDTVIRASFDEIQSFLVHFWQGMPPHLVTILGTNVLVNLVGVCDSILYRAVCSVLMPSVLQAIPDSLTQVIRKFTHDLDSWLRIALDDLPENLRQVKIDLASRFSRMLRRQTSLNHLCQASRMVLHSPEITQQMLQDWRQVDLEAISHQTLYSMDKHSTNGVTVDLIMNLYNEFERLLEEGAPLEAYSEWLEAMVERCVLLGARKSKAPVHKVAHAFLLTWSCFGTRVIRDMTLHSAPSFGSFHLLHLMFDDYVLYLVESLHAEEKARELLNNISTDSPPDCSDPGFGDPDSEDSVHALSFLMGGVGGSSGGGLTGLTSPNTPGVSPNPHPTHDLHLSPTPTTVIGLDGSLVEDDGSLDYMSGLSNSSSGGLNAQGAPATPNTTSAAASVAATSLVTGGGGGGGGAGGGGGGGSGGSTADYYGYDYDSRTYRLPSTLVGRNYLYPPTSVPLNQYYQGGGVGGDISGPEDRLGGGGGGGGVLHGGGGGAGGGGIAGGAADHLGYSSLRGTDTYVDCSGVYCPDQSLLYPSNYYQGYDASYYSTRFKTKDVEG